MRYTLGSHVLCHGRPAALGRQILGHPGAIGCERSGQIFHQGNKETLSGDGGRSFQQNAQGIVSGKGANNLFTFIVHDGYLSQGTNARLLITNIKHKSCINKTIIIEKEAHNVNMARFNRNLLGQMPAPVGNQCQVALRTD